METGVGPPSQDVLDAVEAAKRAVAQIKQESGETESGFADPKRYPYPPTHGRNFGDNPDIFPAFSVPSNIDKDFGHNEPLNLPVHFQQQPHISEEGAAVPSCKESHAAYSHQQAQAANSDGHQGQAHAAALSMGNSKAGSEMGPLDAMPVHGETPNHVEEPPAVIQESEHSTPEVKKVCRFLFACVCVCVCVCIVCNGFVGHKHIKKS